MPQTKEAILPLDREAWLLEERGEEIRKRLTYILLRGGLDRKNLKGRVIDLGTGSGAGLVALEALGVTQVVGVEDGSRLRKSLDKIHNILINPFEAFSPADILRQQGKIVEMSNEQYLKIIKEKGWKASLITCFWIGYEPPMRQIEEVLIPGGQVIITAAEDCHSVLERIPGKTNLETEIIRIPGEVADGPVNDDLILVGTKITSESLAD